MDTNKVRARVLAFMREQHMTASCRSAGEISPAGEESGRAGQSGADRQDGILAAVSGGADSVCLLFLLHTICGELSLGLAAFHLNHGLRGAEADRDEAYVRELCSRLEVPFFSAQEDAAAYGRAHGMSTEEAGRNLRYQYLEETARELSFSRIATAHHRDDNAETVLLNLFRGSGLRGLGGIRPVRGHIIRPLLCLSRKEIEEYLTENGISWCEDSTNHENEYMRNKIRNELLPWVEENVNDRAAEHIAGVSSLAAEADGYLAGRAEELLAAYMEPEEPRTISFPTDLLDAQPEVLKLYLIRAMLLQAAGQAKDISGTHIRSVLGLFGPGGGRSVSLPYGLRAVRSYGSLEIGPEKKKETHRPDPEFHVFSWKKEREIPKNQYTKWFDYDKIMDTLSVRNRREGDFITLSGNRRKLVRRYMIDEKIPEADRDGIWLLADGSHILWIIGYRISEYYKVTDNTKNIMEVRICKGEENG